MRTLYATALKTWRSWWFRIAVLPYARNEKTNASDDAGMEIYVEQASTHTSKKESIFEDVSIAQILAGALAAVTSMLFASQIGIAGSVIGVAVASVVATVSSQLYKRVLSKSADKIRDLRSSDDDTTSSSSAVLSQGSDQATALLEHPAAVDEGKTVCMEPSSMVSQTPHIGDDNANIGDELLRQRAQKRRKQQLQRRVIVVSIASALVAVAVSVFLINVVTAGAGIGTKTAPIVSTVPQTQVTDTTLQSNGGPSPDSSANTESTGSSKTDTQAAPSTTGTTSASSSSSTQTPSSPSGTQSGSNTGTSTTGGSSTTTEPSGTTGSGSSSDTTKSDQPSSSTTDSSGTTTPSATTSK